MTQVIVRNDGLDSDNMGTFMTTVKWASATSGAKLVVIYEPRLVDFSLKILKPDDRDHLDNLLKLHFAKYGKPLKICLNGLLSHEEINKLTNVSREDKDLLRMAVNPSNDLEGPKQHDSLEDRRVDSRLHASLVARDLARCLEELLKASNRQAEVTILVDMDALQDTGPVNLKCHDPEQLFNRTPQDIREFWRSMNQPEKSRREKLREWCKARIEEADKEPQNSTILVKNLDYGDLTNRIKATEGVTFIEGASFHLLRRLIDDPEVAAKIDCVVQAGTLEASNNIFTNQFNIALDKESAEHVLQNTTLFRSFVAIPTQTSLSIPFSFGNLEEKGFSTLARWILCFNRREDPLKVAEGNVTLAGKAASQGGPVTVAIKLPDLAMVLLAFDPEKYPRETSRVEVQMQGESLLFVESERGIPIFLPKGGHTYKAVDLVELLTSEVEGSFRINWGT